MVFKRRRESISAGDVLDAIAKGWDVDIDERSVINGDLDIVLIKFQLDSDKFHCRPVIKGKIKIWHSEIRGNINFRGAIFNGYVDFRGTIFNGDVKLGCTTFSMNAIFDSAIFNKEANFESATFIGNAHFSSATFNGNLYFYTATCSEYVFFKNAAFNDNAYFHSITLKHQAIFEDVKYWSDSVRTYLARFLTAARLRDVNGDATWWDRFIKWVLRLIKGSPEGIPHRPTQFYLDSQNLDEVYNPHFKRYVSDQQYIRLLRENHRIIYGVWKLTSNCGKSMILWLLVCASLAILFGTIYYYGFSECFVFTNEQLGQISHWYDYMYYSVVTFTTLGFGDIVPSQPWARFVVALEVVFGYIMLGGLISIFANKLARRS